MHIRKFLYVLCLAWFISTPAAAQFYTTGNNPASTKWSFITSPNYKVIYPEGLDSLARAYALSLEKYRLDVGRSVKYTPGEMTCSRMPVVLHPFNAYANGSVAWAPKRMDLYTSPQAYQSEPMPWMRMLSVHESRHVAQMQFGLSHVFRPFKYIFGEMFNGLLSGLYPNRWLLEGDAVIAETALTNSGRGRTADFLNYYRIAFDNGDYRNYDRWAYGSYKHYTPNHYAFGYLILSNIRYTYDVPEFSGELFRRFARNPFDLSAKQTVTRRLTGEKNFYTLVDSAVVNQAKIWTEDIQARGPFLPWTDISRMRGGFTEYTDNLIVENDLYSLKESFRKSRKLVKIDSTGREKTIRSFASEVGMLYWSPYLDKIIWSETVPDKRWGMKYNSRIRMMDVKSGKIKNLTREGRLFNPSPSPSEQHIAVTEYTDDGRSYLTVLDGLTGEEEIAFDLPDSLQLVESAWLDHRIFATCISSAGYGIYHLYVGDPNRDEYDWEETLAPSPVMIFNFGSHGGQLMFTSDRTGADEMYLMDPDSGTIMQMTSSRYGGVDYTFTADEKYLICSLHDHKGKRLVRISADSLLYQPINFFDRHRYPVADKLSSQEQALAAAAIQEPAVSSASSDAAATGDNGPEISEPKKYRKFPNSFNFHSWAPFYFSYDKVSNFSFDHIYEAVSLGAVAIFQDNLSTLYGQVGYSAHKDPNDKSYWRHSAHLNLTYTGWYPVFELNVDFNDRAASRMSMVNYYSLGGATSLGSTSSYTSAPYFNADLSVYVPFNFSSGGWLRGLVPQVTYGVTNDVFSSDIFQALVLFNPETGRQEPHLTGIVPGEQVWRQNLSAALRYYTMLPTAHSEIYPDLGIGVEVGAHCSPGLLNMLSSAAYAYVYGYLPGITGNQGLRLSGLFRQQLFMESSVFVSERMNLLPRGLSSHSELLSYTAGSESVLRLTADYAIPFYMGDFQILRSFYVKRGILTPHFDYTFMGGYGAWSAGASLAIEFGNFFKLSFPMQIGVTYSYSGGSLLSAASFTPSMRHWIGPVFDITF